jgi:hypothetical protein
MRAGTRFARQCFRAAIGSMDKGRAAGMELLRKLLALPFEKTCFDTLHRYVTFAHGQLCLAPPFKFQAALTGIRDLSFRFEHEEPWGPFHNDTIEHEAILRSVEPTAVSAALLGFFEAVYDETPFARPQNLFGFPPGPPDERAPVQFR